MSTNFFVLQRADELDTARSAELQARITYAKTSPRWSNPSAPCWKRGSWKLSEWSVVGSGCRKPAAGRSKFPTAYCPQPIACYAIQKNTTVMRLSRCSMPQ